MLDAKIKQKQSVEKNDLNTKAELKAEQDKKWK